MRVYFDTSCLSRPLDNRSIPRNEVERGAILEMFTMARRGDLTVVISEVVLAEIRKTPDEDRREQLEELLDIAGTVIPLTDAIVQRGVELQSLGFGAFDALHLAVAESASLDFFCTADDRLKRRSRKQPSVKLQVVSPLELFQELNQ